MKTICATEVYDSQLVTCYFTNTILVYLIILLVSKLTNIISKLLCQRILFICIFVAIHFVIALEIYIYPYIFFSFRSVKTECKINEEEKNRRVYI